SLGGHVRRHGHTAESYREAMGLCRSRPLVAGTLSRSIATRQSAAYLRSLVQDFTGSGLAPPKD
ncbi:MAG: hypothetical protein WCC65_18140, partial [Pseudonocardiaceae bacterium]